MESNPFVGYVKAGAFGILAFVVFISFWQRNKTEDKIVSLEAKVGDVSSQIGDMTRETSLTTREISELRGRTEAILKLLKSRKQVVVVDGGTKSSETDRDTDDDDDSTDEGPSGGEDWGWSLNAGLDKDVDPGRPVGTPGRYKNFLKLDPAGPDVHPEASNFGATINIPFASEPKGFNYLLENFAGLTEHVEIYCSDTPGKRHWKAPSSFNWAPAMCWRVEVNEDYTEYTLFFRKDMNWQKPPGNLTDYPFLAGTHPITAHDSKFTFDIIQDSQSNCAVQRSYLDELKNVKVIDDHTLVIQWNKTQFTSLAQSLAHNILPKFVYNVDEKGDPYPKETVAQEFNEHWFDALRYGPVGAGPYRFTKYEAGKYIRMERWDRWYGFKDQPLYPIRTRHLRIYEETETAMNWLRTGDVDIGGLNAARYQSWWLERDKDKSSPFNGKIQVYTAPATSYLYIGWKNTDPMFEDKRVRWALTHATDRQQICEKIFLNRYTPMGAPLYPSSSEADPSLKPPVFDLNKSRALLDAAGWKMNPGTGLREKVINGEVRQFRFKLNWPGPSAEFQNALDHIKNDYLKIGVQMEPVSSQWAQFQQDLRDRQFVAFSLLWVLNGWEHDFGQIWHGDRVQDPGSSNYIEFQNKELDTLQDSLRTLMDPGKRVKAIQRIGRILYDEQPYTFFGWRQIFRGYWKHVKGVEENRYYFRPLMRTLPFTIDR